MRNRIYTIDMDSNMDGAMRELQKRFHPKERVVSTDIRENKYIVMTVIDDGSPRNLLLEEIDSGKIPASILGLKPDKEDA